VRHTCGGFLIRIESQPGSSRAAWNTLAIANPNPGTRRQVLAKTGRAVLAEGAVQDDPNDANSYFNARKNYS
jgi:hypothetical protein